jgi:hypothetical protein
MPFSTELDAFLAKVQARVDEALGEARTELTEMAVEAEREWSLFSQKFREGFCADADDPSEQAPSHPETSVPTEDGPQAS